MYSINHQTYKGSFNIKLLLILINLDRLKQLAVKFKAPLS